MAVSECLYSSRLWHRYSSKALALFASIWLIVNWVLTCALLLTPNTLDKAFYYGVRHAAVDRHYSDAEPEMFFLHIQWLTFFTVPVPLFIVFDWPRKRPILYQLYITVTIWSWYATFEPNNSMI